MPETLMSFSKQKQKESIISILILILLLLIGSGIFLYQRKTDISRFGMQSSSLMIESQQIQTPDIETFRPQDFITLSTASIYDEDNLYEKINGKAPLYTESGFQKLYTQRFISQANQDLWFELYMYDMGDIRNAFSVYSTQKRMDVKKETALNVKFNYKTSNGLYFVCEKYYMELVGSAESPQLLTGMVQTAININQAINTGDSEIEELNLFPKENLIPDSFKMEVSNGFGFDGWKNLFSAKYNIDNNVITVFLNKQPDNAKAEKIADNYCKFLIESGAEEKQPANKQIIGKILDVYNTFEVILTKGNLVLGVHEADNQQLAEKAVMEIIDRIEQTK